MSIRMGQPKTQWNDQSFAMDMNWTDTGVKTAELSPNMVSRVPPTIVLVLVEDILQYFVDSPQADTMLVLSTAQTAPRTVIVLSGKAPLCLTSKLTFFWQQGGHQMPYFSKL
jgi:hypothetical protein